MAAPQIHISGVSREAVVRASTVDARGQTWTSTTNVDDVRRDPARPLFTLGHGDDLFLPPSRGFVVSLDLIDGGRTVAQTTIERRWTGPGVRTERVRDGLYGDLFEPSGSGHRSAALVIGGSDGGLTTGGDAALLASHGFPALALAYFRAHAHPDLRFENAGHGLGAAIPYLPSPTVRDFGGSVAADEAAKAVLWPRILRFMGGLPAA
jgi:hypothetical protein